MTFHDFAGLPYRLSGPAKAAITCVVISQIGTLAIAWCEIRNLAFFNLIEEGNTDQLELESQGAALDAISGPISYVSIGLLIIAYIVSAVWIYRASTNANAVQPGPKRITPGWSVGWYAIPFANWVMPFQAMRQTWNTSVNKTGNIDAPAPALLGWWWACWVIASLAGSVAYRMSNSAVTVDHYQRSSMLTLLSTPVELVSAVLFITIIRRITEMQAKMMTGNSAYEQIFN